MEVAKAHAQEDVAVAVVQLVAGNALESATEPAVHPAIAVHDKLMRLWN